MNKFNTIILFLAILFWIPHRISMHPSPLSARCLLDLQLWNKASSIYKFCYTVAS